MMRKVTLLFLLLLLFGVPALGERSEMQACPEDFDNIWAIQDDRLETEDELITRMYNGEDRLGYDALSRTFYCSMRMSASADWPEVSLSAEGAEGLSLIWEDQFDVDDYASAIRRGLSYTFMAYTNEAFAEYHLVFVGLPIVIIDTAPETEIDEEYVPAEVSVSSGEFEAISSDAQVHLRAAGDVHEYEKVSYRIRFRRTTKKGNIKNNKLSVLGMEADSSWLLLANAREKTCVHNYLCWKLWNRWNAGTKYFTPLESRMVEVFSQNRYMGIYELLQRVRIEDELERMGMDPERDVVIRVIHKEGNVEKYPAKFIGEHHTSLLQIRYKPETLTEEEAFAALADYEAVYEEGSEKPDDETFIAMMAEHFDIEELMSLFAFYNAVYLCSDNVENNLWIWTEIEQNNVKYHLSVWDMDRAMEDSAQDNPSELCIYMTYAMRLLDLDALNSREIYWRIWEEKKASLMNEEGLYPLFLETGELLSTSGAYRREAERWTDRDAAQDLSYSYTYVLEHLERIDSNMREFWPLKTRTAE